MFYLVKTPWFIKKFYPECIWEMKSIEKELYLTFDDGPNPGVTPFVLEALKKYKATATFFCIGKNVEQYLDIYKKVIEHGHSVGNHTDHHLNGWKTQDKVYLDDIQAAKKVIDSNLFRPPYGRITKFQLSQLKSEKYQLKTVMWSVLSGDFDPEKSGDDCFLSVARNAKSGSVVVFHDSEKAFSRMQYALPKVLEYFCNKGYNFKGITL